MTYHLKNMKVNGKDDIHIAWKIKAMFETTNQNNNHGLLW